MRTYAQKMESSRERKKGGSLASIVYTCMAHYFLANNKNTHVASLPSTNALLWGKARIVHKYSALRETF